MAGGGGHAVSVDQLAEGAELLGSSGRQAFTVYSCGQSGIVCAYRQ